jgi:ABC-type antimicrobial peptide transport system permease subunit
VAPNQPGNLPWVDRVCLRGPARESNMPQWRYVWRELLLRRRRTWVNVSLIALAVGFFLVLTLLSGAFRAAFRAPLNDVGANLTLQRAGDVPQEMKGAVLPCSLAPISGDEVQAVKQLPGVLSLSPAFLFWDFSPDTFRIVAGFNPATSSGFALLGKVLTQGRFLKPGDRRQVVLETAYARERGLKPGDRLVVDGREFTVVGLVDSSRLSQLAAAQVYMPLTEARALAAASPGVTAIHQLGKADVNLVFLSVVRDKIPQVSQAIKALLGDKVTVTGPQSFQRAIGGLLAATDRFGMVAAVLSLLAAVLLVMRTTAGNLRERKAEVAIMKAVGWTRADIGRQLTAETLVQTLAGGLAGMLAALAGAWLASWITIPIPLPWDLSPRPHFLPGGGDQLFRQVPLQPVLDPVYFALALAAALFLGGMAAWMALRAVARLKPSEALRHV